MGCCNYRKRVVKAQQLLVTIVVVVVVLALTLVSIRGCEGAAAAAKKEKKREEEVVGEEEEGWTLPPGPFGHLNYSSWALNHTFHVGDTLVFQYQPELHNVLQVKKDDYDNCNVDAPLASFFDGNTTISLNRSGMWYFICGFSDHCSLGQKVALTCLDSTPNKHLATSTSSKQPSTSLPYFSSTPSSPFFDPPASIYDTPYFSTPSPPGTSDTPYYNPTPPTAPDTLYFNPPPSTSNNPISIPYPPPPFVSPSAPEVPPSDSTPSGSSSTNTSPPLHSDSPRSNECPFDHQFPPPPPLMTTSPPPPPPLAPPSNPSKSNSKAIFVNSHIYVLVSFLMGIIATLMTLV